MSLIQRTSRTRTLGRLVALFTGPVVAVSQFPLQDQFTRARPNLAGTQTDSGQTWVSLGGQLSASGGVASPTADANSFVYAAVGTPGLRLQTKFVTMNQVQGMYLLNRSTDQNDGVMLVARNNAISGFHEVWIYDVSAGVNTRQDDGTIPLPTAGQVVGLQIVGSNALVYYDGTLIKTVALLSAKPTATSYGFGVEYSNQCPTITTTQFGEIRAYVPVTVGSVIVTPSTLSLTQGNTYALSAAAHDTNGNPMTGQTFTWSSSNTAVATVDSSGTVTAVAAGSCTITATDAGVSGTCALTVTAAGTSTVDLAAMSALNRQFPRFADGGFTFPGLSLTRGQTYTEPYSGFTITKASDPNWPVANTGYYPDYAGIWCGLSNAWGPNGCCTLIGRLENGGGFYLVDFDPTQATDTLRISNGRLVVKQPALDTCTQMSPVAGEAQIAYIFSADRHLYRIDTAGNAVAPSGNHLSTGKDYNAYIDASHLAVDVQVTQDGRYIAVLSTAYDYILLWDTQTNKDYKLPVSESGCHGFYLSPDGKYVLAAWDGGGIHSGNTGSIFDLTQIFSALGGGSSPITVPATAPYKFDMDTVVDTAHVSFALASGGSVLPTKRNDTAATGWYDPSGPTWNDNGIALSDVKNPNQDHFATQWLQPTRAKKNVMVLASNYAGDRITPDISGWSVAQGTGANTIYKCTVDYTGGGNNQSAAATSAIAATNFNVLHKNNLGYYVGNAHTFSNLSALATAIGNGTTDVTAYDTANGTVIASHGACALDHATGTWYQWQPGGADPTNFADAFAPMGLELGVDLVSVNGQVTKFIAHAYTFMKAGGTYGENYWAATHGNQSHDGRFVAWASSQGTQDTQGGTYRIDTYIVALPTTTNTTPVPTSITVSPAGPLTMNAGNTQSLAATVYDQFGFDMPGEVVTWGSNATGVATVNSSGLVTAVAPGTATITATDGSASKTVTVNVTGGTTVSDSFNRADNATSLGTADTGQAWVAQNGTWGISSNQAYCASTTGVNFATIDSGTADLTVTVTLPVIDNAGGLVVRYTDANHYIAMRARVGDAWYLYANNGSGESVIGDTGVTPNAGDTIALVLSGSTITPKINGTSYTPVTNSTNQTATQHGLMTSNTNVPRFDNYDAR